MLRRASSLQNFDLAPRCSDLVLSGLAEFVGVHCERNFQVAVSQDFHAVMPHVNDPTAFQSIRRDNVSRMERIEHFHVYDREAFRKWAVKAALRDAPVQRHLAALKSSTSRRAAAGLLAFISGTGRLAHL